MPRRRPRRSRCRSASSACSSRSPSAQDRIVRARTCTGWCGARPLRDGDRSVDVYVHKLRAKLEEALPGTALHPHARGLRLPVLAGAFTCLSHPGHRPVTSMASPEGASLQAIIEQRLHDPSLAALRRARLRRRRLRRRRRGDRGGGSAAAQRVARGRGPLEASSGTHPHRRLVDRPADRRGGAPSCSRRRPRTSRSPSAAPAPATASSASAAARSTIADASRADRGRGVRGLQEGQHRPGRGPGRHRRPRRSSPPGPRVPERLHHDRAAQEAARAEVQGRQLLRAGRRLPRPEGHVLHAGHRVGHVRLLHRGGPRDRRRAAHEGRPDVGRRQPDRHRHRGHRGRAGLRRLRVRRGEQGQAQDPRGRRRRRLRRARRSRRSPDGSYKPLSRPLFMYPTTETVEEAGGQGLHRASSSTTTRRSSRPPATSR